MDRAVTLSWERVGSRWGELTPFERDWIVQNCSNKQLVSIVSEVLPGRVDVLKETFGFKYRAKVLDPLTCDFDNLSEAAWWELFRLGKRASLLDRLVSNYLIAQVDAPMLVLFPGEYDELKRRQLLDDDRLVRLARSEWQSTVEKKRALIDLFAREGVDEKRLCEAVEGFLCNGGDDKQNVALVAGLVRNYMFDTSSGQLTVVNEAWDLFKLPLTLCPEEWYVSALVAGLTWEQRISFEGQLGVHLKEHYTETFRPSDCDTLSPWTFCRLWRYGLLSSATLVEIVSNAECKAPDADEESRVWAKLLSPGPLTGVPFQMVRRRSLAPFKLFGDSVFLGGIEEGWVSVCMSPPGWCRLWVHGLVNDELKETISSLVSNDFDGGMHTQPAAWALRLLFFRIDVSVHHLIDAMKSFWDVHGSKPGSLVVAVQVLAHYLRRDDVDWYHPTTAKLVRCIYERGGAYAYSRALLEQFSVKDAHALLSMLYCHAKTC